MTTVRERDDATGTMAVGAQMHALAARLYPICRSVTGQGVRDTLSILREIAPLQVREVPSGTAVFDWTVPPEWNVRDAYVANARGERVIDFARHNLHLVQYSRPIRERMTLDALRPHLHSLPDRPAAIPYRTSYYADDWGFCLAHRALLALGPGEYDVVIDASLEPGSLTYGELLLPGTTSQEVLIHSHICHPSLANDNLSGLVVAAFLAGRLGQRASRRYSYRFLFLPGTIGPITWLALNRRTAGRIRHGLVLSGIGNDAPFTYKQSRRGNAEIDRVLRYVLRARPGSRVCEFEPYGYDERQYCSPGFNLPVGCLMRSLHGTYPEYHTDADDLEFIRPEALEEALMLTQDVVDLLEMNRTCRSRAPFGEPQLGRRGLYRARGGENAAERQRALLWVLNLSDGRHAILDIAERSGLPVGVIDAAARDLEAAGLLRVGATVEGAWS